VGGPVPPADARLYSNILYDWPPEKASTCCDKSYEGLEPGGRILIQGALFDHDKMGP
jgi:hypothetical protein